jgi:hypothetical protein
VPLAHAEVSGDGRHLGAREPFGGVQGQLRRGAASLASSSRAPAWSTARMAAASRARRTLARRPPPIP